MPEKETLRANTAQILRNIEAFRKRLKKGKNRFGLISNSEEVKQEMASDKPQIEQIPESPKIELKSFINSAGRGYAPHFVWGINGPSAFNHGGNI